MKTIKFLFIAILFVSIKMLAATDTLKTSGVIQVWKESVVGDSRVLGQAGYVYGHTATSDTLKGATNALISPIFGVGNGVISTKARNLCSGTKFMVGINVTTAYTGGAATLIVQGSGDGVNWTTAATASANLSSVITGTGVTWYLVDLTSIYLPYYRLIFNGGNATVNRAGELQFLYALPNAVIPYAVIQ